MPRLEGTFRGFLGTLRIPGNASDLQQEVHIPNMLFDTVPSAQTTSTFLLCGKVVCANSYSPAKTLQLTTSLYMALQATHRGK
jgi:hypothetical protein